MFSVTNAPEAIKIAPVTDHFGFGLEKTIPGKSLHYREVNVFKRLCFKNIFCPQQNVKPTFLNFSALRRPRKARFRDGLVWIIGLRILPLLCGQRLRRRTSHTTGGSEI